MTTSSDVRPRVVAPDLSDPAVAEAPITIRPLAASDRELYTRAVAGLSATTYLLRFGSVRRELTDAEITAFLDVGHDGRVALIAILSSGPYAGEIVGVVRYAPVDSDPAEVEAAIVVSDAWQGTGVGRRLLDALLVRACSAGVRSVWASALIENRTVATMLRHRGFRLVNAEVGVSEWLMANDPSTRS